jgi:hypothetical protein
MILLPARSRVPPSSIPHNSPHVSSSHLTTLSRWRASPCIEQTSVLHLPVCTRSRPRLGQPRHRAVRPATMPVCSIILAHPAAARSCADPCRLPLPAPLLIAPRHLSRSPVHAIPIPPVTRPATRFRSSPPAPCARVPGLAWSAGLLDPVKHPDSCAGAFHLTSGSRRVLLPFLPLPTGFNPAARDCPELLSPIARAGACPRRLRPLRGRWTMDGGREISVSVAVRRPLVSYPPADRRGRVSQFWRTPPCAYW